MQSQIIGMQSSLDRILSAVQPQAQHSNAEPPQFQQPSYPTSSPRREGAGFSSKYLAPWVTVNYLRALKAPAMALEDFLHFPDSHHPSV